MHGPFTAACLFLLLPVAVGAQQPVTRTGPPPAPRGVALPLDSVVYTKLESLLATPSTIITTDYYHIDTRFGPNVSIDAVVVTAAELHTRLRGMRIGIRDDAKPAERSGWSFLDYEEIASLSRALGAISDFAAKWTGREDQRSTDLTFTSLSGFAVGVHEVGHIQRAFLSTGFVDPVRSSIEITDFVALRQAVDQALAALANKEPESR